jgi:biotin-dependent carboxylase-like uncharacterized protein
MTAGLKVVAPGLHTSVQDLGRFGYRSAGVPVSGALDRIALMLANALVGNPANTPALEILVQGPVLEVVAPAVRVALVGGSGGLIVEGEHRRTVASGQSLRLIQGDRLRMAPLGTTSCAYLAVEGGFDVAPALGSASTYARGGFGGFCGRVLRAGDVLPVRQTAAELGGELALAKPFEDATDQTIRVVLGPQLDFFTQDAVRIFLSARFTVSSRADRMGYRLDGPQLAHAKGYNIVSDAIATGSIQVPGSGQPIVLLVDSQTTGGYPKIATVISADLPVIGRRGPGAAVQFAAVTPEEAEDLRRTQEKQIAQSIRDFRKVEETAGIDLTELYAANLVDGVTNALD